MLMAGFQQYLLTPEANFLLHLDLLDPHFSSTGYITPDASSQELPNPNSSFTDWDREENRPESYPALTDEDFFLKYIDPDGGEHCTNDTPLEDKIRCPNALTSGDGSVGTEVTSDNSSVDTETSSKDSPVDAETSSKGSPVDAETSSGEDPLDTDTTNGNDGTETVDNSTAKPPTIGAIASATVDVEVKGKADVVDTDDSCGRHTRRTVSSLRLSPGRRRVFDGIATNCDTGVDDCHTGKRRRVARSDSEVLVLTSSPYDERRHPMDSHETGSSEDIPIDLTGDD
jgi:hypothetical protein